MAHDYDLFVIGGGSGGVRAARVSSDEHGARVGLAEASRLGGTCVQRGCVPKKLMVFASEFRPLFDEAEVYGWDVPEEPSFRWPRFHERLQAELDRLEGVYRGLLEGSGVTVHDAWARIEGPHAVSLSTGETVTADTILVATGGEPNRPPIPGAELGMVSDDMFKLEELPREMLIVGGGYIACEFACMMNGMGVDVTVWHRGAQILRGFDDEARGMIAEGMIGRGVDLHLGSNLVALEQAGQGRVRARSSTGAERDFDAVLLATGRNPSTKGLGLEEVGVELTRGGAIRVDDLGRTSVPSIWAVGDVTDRVQLTPVAIREGMAFARNRFGGESVPFDHRLIPSAVFTQPEMGSVGLTEEDAVASGVPVDVYAASFKPMRTNFAGRPDRAMMKLVVHADQRTVLGAHIVAPSAAEMIQFCAVAVKAGLTKEQFDDTCAVHPTVAEEMVTMRRPVRSY